MRFTNVKGCSDLRAKYPKLPVVHVSDLNSYRYCRRKWDFCSYMRQNLERVDEPIEAFWFGTGIHFGLEDLHGYKEFPSAAAAFEFFVMATEGSRPDTWREALELGKAMLDYYELEWLTNRRDYQTVWIDKTPLVEVDFQCLIRRNGRPFAIFEGIFDGVLKDAYHRFWLAEYKTAKRMSTSGKLENDTQITAYTYAAEKIFGTQFEGIVHQQHLKDTPSIPQVLKTGGISKNKQIKTTFALYKKALVDYYGEGKIPSDYDEMLNMLLENEQENGNGFVWRNLVRRNPMELASFEKHLIMMVSEMISKKLPIYPNSSHMAGCMCDFKSVCLAMDEGSDYGFILDNEFARRDRDKRTDWRAKAAELGQKIKKGGEN